MPELPDLEVYLHCLRPRILGARLEAIRLGSPFVLRSLEPPPRSTYGRTVTGLRRLGKRIVIELDQELYLVMHLMIAGRLLWEKTGAKLPKKAGLAAFDFTLGSLLLREAGSKRRASLHIVAGEQDLMVFDRGGLEVLAASFAEFRDALLRENHTLKRALTDPSLLSGIGNAYSDEILHQARLSPLKHTRHLADDELQRLFESTRETLARWTDRLLAEAGEGFPRKVTAFREGMSVHGRYRQPCPVCGSPVQRIVYAENECNYCARCQTGGRLLADRALSRLLKQDWPRTLEELEEQRPSGQGGTPGASPDAVGARRRRQ